MWFKLYMFLFALLLFLFKRALQRSDVLLCGLQSALHAVWVMNKVYHTGFYASHDLPREELLFQFLFSIFLCQQNKSFKARVSLL